ncbi:hypothetical protein JOE58_002871 [Curtobacterium luteum]|uniref:Uncharacterized protein n=1 Tax=Curtobacterium luteum TaxID=33881 RepID=A0A8H9GAW2_9MICO|nr:MULTISPECIES: hypothetical protein [Curtobacterium]MBM7803620.1 hypothetical protein [Curtobacterium luteum]NUU50109.1 hypothetical protein [Curtobacterium luteum]GGK99203.1 hypothetical protein GCM10009769_16640 [Curtobacterium luteum]
MTFRPALALGVAVLAASATTIASGAPARASEPSWGSSSAPRVTNGTLAHVDAVELHAESLVFERDDRTVAVVSMRDARTTVDVLDRLLGTPARTHTAEGDGGACFPAGTTYTWGGAVRVAALATPADLGNAVEIRVLRDDVRTRNGTTVELSGPRGVQVGDDIAGRIAKTDRADRMSFGAGDEDEPSAWQVLLQRGWDATDGSSDDRRADTTSDDPARTAAVRADEDGRNGVSALTDGTTVAVLGSPMPVNATRSC